MKIRFLAPFLKQYAKLPAAVQKKVDAQTQLLATSLRHPGTHAKKLHSKGDIWEARVDYHFRLTFMIEGDAIVFRKVGTHEIYRKP